MYGTRPTSALLLCRTNLAVLLLAFAVRSDSGAAAPPASAQPDGKVPQEVIYLPDIHYGTAGKEKLLLDLARPRRGTGLFPAVLVLHGGGWTAGSRKYCRPVILELARHGHVAVAASYRLAPRHRFPAQLHDARCAVRWLRAHAARHRIDPQRIAALGFSSGGHLACLLGTASNLEGDGCQAGHSSRVQLVVAYYPVTDLASLDKGYLHTLVLKNLLGRVTPETCAEASPMTHACRRCPPTLLLHGTADWVVPPSQSRDFAKKLRTVGAAVELHLLDGAGHGFGCGPGAHDRQANRAAREFLKRHFRPSLSTVALKPGRACCSRR